MADDTHLEMLGFLDDLPEQDLNEILDGIRNGARTPSELFGFDAEALNAIEQIALGYYRARHFGKAAVLYGFILQMNPHRATTWRGLGAVSQALKNYHAAVPCFLSATIHDPTDVISHVLLGELCCMQGDTHKGLAILETALQIETDNPAYKPYLTRAKAIVSAKGGLPPPIVIKQKGADLAREARAKVAAEHGTSVEDDEGEFQFNPEQELTWAEAKKHPKLRKAIEKVDQYVADGTLTYKDVAGFTNDQMDGAYKIAAGYVEANQLLEAVQLTSMMLFLDPYSAPFHKLQGITYHRLKQYLPAEYHYGMAVLCDPGDIESIIYRGEALVMAGKVDEGLQEIQKGLEKAQSAPNGKPLVKRAQTLLQQLSK